MLLNNSCATFIYDFLTLIYTTFFYAVVNLLVYYFMPEAFSAWNQTDCVQSGKPESRFERGNNIFLRSFVT